MHVASGWKTVVFIDVTSIGANPVQFERLGSSK